MSESSFSRTFEHVYDGFATPHSQPAVPGPMTGCIYRADGSKVALSERFGGHMGDHVVSDNPDRAAVPQAASRRPGRGLFLGHFMGGHYGHFITETLCTFWIFEEFPAHAFDYFLFYPFTFGLAAPAYVDRCFEAFDIDRSKVVFMGEEAMQFAELLVPERLFRLNYSTDPRLKWVYERIVDRTVASAPRSQSPDRIYLSRRKFSRSSFDRVVANEVLIERAFEARGFTAVYPEELDFPRQVALYSQASVVAGISGSGLHNSVFMRRGACLLELGDPRYDGAPAPTQALCNQISAVRSAFIPFEGRRFGPRGTMLFDMSRLTRAIDVALRKWRKGGAQAHVGARPTSGLSERFEIAYLSVRPVVGWWARRVIRLMVGLGRS